MQCDWLTFWRYFDFLYGVNTRQRCKSALNKRPNQAIRFFKYFTLISHSVSYYTSNCLFIFCWPGFTEYDFVVYIGRQDYER